MRLFCRRETFDRQHLLGCRSSIFGFFRHFWSIDLGLVAISLYGMPISSTKPLVTSDTWPSLPFSFMPAISAVC